MPPGSSLLLPHRSPEAMPVIPNPPALKPDPLTVIPNPSPLKPGEESTGVGRRGSPASVALAARSALRRVAHPRRSRGPGSPVAVWRSAGRLRLAIAFFLLPLAGCIEDRLSVEIHTQLHLDGTCTRRIEYVLERVDPDRGGARVPFGEDGGLRRMHRFPSGEEWRIDEETAEGFHRLAIEATLPSPNDFDGDFFRSRTPSTPPARNFISAYTDVDEGVFEYNEVFRDPVSPLAGLRALARQAASRDGDFARLFAEAVDGSPGAPSEPQLRQAFHAFFADPLVQDLSTLTSRPLYGPRERRAFETIVDGMDGRQEDLSREVQRLSPGLPPEDVGEAVGAALDTLGESVLKEAEESGVSLALFERESPIEFRATLVMPWPIRRCNACAMGDTAVWEFDEQDLYGRGFEMTALASAP